MINNRDVYVDVRAEAKIRVQISLGNSGLSHCRLL